MKQELQKHVNVAKALLQIQEQLAALDKKLETFINKSLTDIAQALAAQKAVVASRPVQPPVAPIRPPEQRRPMFAIVCYQCGKDCEIPFKPTPGRPVYCPECFAMRKIGNVIKANHEVKVPVVEVKTTQQSITKTVARAKKKPIAFKKPATKKAKKINKK